MIRLILCVLTLEEVIGFESSEFASVPRCLTASTTFFVRYTLAVSARTELHTYITLSVKDTLRANFVYNKLLRNW